MFGFYIGKPVVAYSEDKEYVYLDVNGFGETLSGGTRNVFIDAGINEILKKNSLETIGNGETVIIKYTKIKKNLEKIRYDNYISGTNILWIDDAINNAVKKFGEKNIFCKFE